ncbi:Lipid phosphate phosphatase [Thalictrum thalictroides]|uniref:Lipid phosphate phosphatase n=1 Tax=Thalictrum thalictroides TaxID=46969 RepID=A0A7J6X0L9_THATH|nr:Lipid phosphate phosphatase [Thalictrum thalictroides]
MSLSDLSDRRTGFFSWFEKFRGTVLIQGMREVQLGQHTVRSHGREVIRTHMHDWLILLLLVSIKIVLYVIHPFYRFVGKDMMTDLKYPFKENTVPFWAVQVS